jgi:D-serine deaminase-like pyridoxal phosphate-dependent protein
LNQDASGRHLTVDVALEVDCGYHRSGVDPMSEQALSLPRAIGEASHLRFAGILTHAGQSYASRSRGEAAAAARVERDVMLEFAHRLRAAGLEVPCVSVGSTPTMCSGESLDGIDEIRPGNYVLCDAYQAAIGSCAVDDCAVTVLAAVTHRDLAAGRAAIDAGAIALSKDAGPRHVDPECGYGIVCDLDGRPLPVRLTGLSQEHGHLSGDPDTLARLPVGTRVRVLPNHACLAVAQYGCFNVLDDGAIVAQWAIQRGW